VEYSIIAILLIYYIRNYF